MQVKLNKRLTTLSAFINDKENIIDIGCDHGLLGIYLFQNRKNIQIISSDINKEPLKKAHENLKKYNLEEKITLKLGNGLECVNNDTNTIVISGMGGLTIIEILSSIKKYPNIEKIVISPNNDFQETRKTITKLGFKIIKETIVKENNKYYLISEYQKGYEKTDYFFGKLDLNNKEIKDYFQYLYNKNTQILKNIPKKYFIKRLKIKINNTKIKNIK